MNERLFDDFSKVCAKFADAVKEKRYNKINYDVWRYWRDTKYRVKAVFCTDTAKNITIIDKCKMDIFSVNDNSFGEFLYNEYFNEKGTKTMVSGHTITDKEIEKLAKKVANLKNEQLATLAVSATDLADSIAVKSGDYLTWDGSLAISGAPIEGTIIPSVSIDGKEVATIANVATKADKTELTALDTKVDEMISRIDKLESISADNAIRVLEDTTKYTAVTTIGPDGKPRSTYGVLNDLSNVYCNNKEKKEMKNFNFDFGKVMDSQARVSMYGIAVKSPSGTWVAYDKKAEQMMDVDILNFEGMDMLYRMPVALNQVAAGDVIIHMGKPCFVVSFNEEGKSFNVIDIFNAEEKCILPVRSPFGFNFVTKLVSLIDFTGSASADQPFGNMLPFLMMKDGNMDDMLPFLMMSQGGDFASNPMMMMLLMDKGGDKSEIFKMMAIAQMFSQNK